MVDAYCDVRHRLVCSSTVPVFHILSDFDDIAFFDDLDRLPFFLMMANRSQD